MIHLLSFLLSGAATKQCTNCIAALIFTVCNAFLPLCTPLTFAYLRYFNLSASCTFSVIVTLQCIFCSFLLLGRLSAGQHF
jgi:hypothetical protein